MAYGMLKTTCSFGNRMAFIDNLLQANSFSLENSKLCFVQQEMLSAAQNNLPPPPATGGFTPKS